jgi:flagellar basal body-associated protein FliL
MANKKVLIAVVIVLILALGAVTYWFVQKRGGLPTSPQLGEPTSPPLPSEPIPPTEPTSPTPFPEPTLPEPLPSPTPSEPLNY